jgi:hypothetical protein
MVLRGAKQLIFMENSAPFELVLWKWCSGVLDLRGSIFLCRGILLLRKNKG